MIENLSILHDRCNHDCLKSVSISNCKFFKHQGLPSPFTVSKFLDVVVQKSTWQSPGIIEWTSGTTFFKNCILNNKNKLSCTYNNFRIDEKTRWKLMVYDKIETRLREGTVHWTVLRWTSFHHVCPAIFPATSSASADYHNGNSSADSPIPGVTSNRQTLEEIITRQSNASTIVV